MAAIRDRRKKIVVVTETWVRSGEPEGPANRDGTEIIT